MNDFKNEGIAASSAWPYQVNALKNEKRPIASTIPAEGFRSSGKKCPIANCDWA